MQSTPLRLLLALIGLPTAAWADCPAALDDEGFRAQVDRAQEAIDIGDVIAHGAAWRDLQATIPCLQAPVPVPDWARFLVGYAVVEHALGRDWQPALRTALRIAPDVPRDFGPEALRTWTPPTDDAGVDLIDGVWVDGVGSRSAPPLDGPHILQRREGGTWTSRVVTDGPIPADWTMAAPPDPLVVAPDPGPEPAVPAQPPTDHRGLGLRITGWSLAGLGAAGGIGSWMYSRDAIRDPDRDDPWSEEAVQAVKITNYASWGLCGVGAGLAVVGHVQGARGVSVTAGPRGIGIHLRR